MTAMDEWTIKRGDTFFVEYELYAGTNPENLIKRIDLSQVDITCKCRVSPNDPVVIDITPFITVTNAVSGVFQIKIPPSKTTELGQAGQTHFFYGDIQIQEKVAPQDEEKDVETLMDLSITVVDDYTYTAKGGDSSFLL
ncbi:hypothetical protein C942_00511 [Photobacterium marinum]|uniref:Uncharacterized protein n=1 Tax=Photobacterium marinum TaxID=1056511 RepID=L8JEW2_9GAMM|nr:hypothetical protein [Photobacterium marinum]ELR66069.1 hypothetical protein C942_00511 [Photobacterium marinum]